MCHAKGSCATPIKADCASFLLASLNREPPTRWNKAPVVGLGCRSNFATVSPNGARQVAKGVITLLLYSERGDASLVPRARKLR